MTQTASQNAKAAALAERPFSSNQLFCSNLPWAVTGKQLRKSFEVHGEVTGEPLLSCCSPAVPPPGPHPS